LRASKFSKTSSVLLQRHCFASAETWDSWNKTTRLLPSNLLKSVSSVSNTNESITSRTKTMSRYLKKSMIWTSVLNAVNSPKSLGSIMLEH